MVNMVSQNRKILVEKAKALITLRAMFAVGYLLNLSS